MACVNYLGQYPQTLVALELSDWTDLESSLSRYRG